MSVNFTLDDVVAKVREVAAENPDFVYTVPNIEDDGTQNYGCLYRHGANREVPGCIVGHALDRLGYVVEPEFEGTHAASVLGDLLDRDAYIDPGLLWVRQVQRGQDDGKPWGEAVEEADSYARLPVA